VLTHVAAAAFSVAWLPAPIRPPERDCCLQHEPEGFSRWPHKIQLGTPTTLSSCTLAASRETDKRRKVINIIPKRLETLTAIFGYECFCSLLYLQTPAWSLIGTPG
jgi:hypothetical protein